MGFRRLRRRYENKTGRRFLSLRQRRVARSCANSRRQGGLQFASCDDGRDGKTPACADRRSGQENRPQPADNRGQGWRLLQILHGRRQGREGGRVSVEGETRGDSIGENARKSRCNDGPAEFRLDRKSVV